MEIKKINSLLKLKMIVLILVFLLNIYLVYADVGVGISPSKIVLQIEGGSFKELDLLIFNSGDDAMDISFNIEGEIAKFTTFDQKSILVEPEPKPHTLPIKNGKKLIVKFIPPVSKETKKYIGSISATGTPTSDSQFGGSVGVASQVELIVTPTSSIFEFISFNHLIFIGIFLLLVILILVLKKAGLKIKFEKNK